MQAFGGKRCHFLRRYQKTKKTKDFRVLAKARLEESKIFVFFGFFGTPPGKCKLLVRRYQKNQKNQRF